MAYEDEDLAHLRIPLIALVDATNNFAEENLLKRGEKADVFKGVLTLFDAHINVVKLKYSGHLFNFYEDIKRIRSWHRNVVSFVGFCDDKDERLIVFEHVANGSLDKYLSDPIFLTWSQRLHICFGAALGLSNTLGSFKSFKILLDKDWEAKVLFCIESESKNSDLYCLGVILLEVLYGRNSTVEDVNRYLTEMAEKELLDDVILPNLRTQMHTESLSIFSEIAYNCLKDQQPDQQSIYTFDQILKRLEQAIEIQGKHEKLRAKKLAWLKIPLSHIKLATDDFADTYRIESRIYESVYKAELGHFDRESVLTIKGDNKGELPKKTVIIKRFNNLVKITKVSFFAKIEMLSSCKHPNLLSFLGFCDEESEMILVFECAFKETLSDCFRSESTRANLTWEKRIRICLDIAHALKNVDHNMESKPSMKSPVIESVNVFLDENSNAVIANFNVFEINPYAITSLWQPRSGNFRTWFWDSIDVPGIPSGQRLVVDDVYYLGVILFEILTGKLANRSIYMTENVNELASIGMLKNMVDIVIKEEAQHSLDAFSEITYQCLTGSPSQCPTLEMVIKSLEKALHIQYTMVQVQNLGHIKIPLADIKSATHNFDINNLIGSGGYGEVYKAELKLRSKDDHLDTPNIVAIKRITSRKDTQGIEGFFSELDVVSKCKHPNIVSLIGFCFEDGEMLLVYEFATNGSLDECLRNIDTTSKLTWAQRLKMCIDIAQGLKCMHTAMEDKKGMIHRDIKSANILLGKNWEAKIADFGLSKVHYGNQKVSTINTTTLAGTEFYLDPEYARTGRLKKASDIYSLGVVLFEIFSGKLAYDSNYVKMNEKGLPPIARRHFKRGTLKEILDPKTMDDTYELGFIGKVEPDQDSLDVFSRIAYQCVAKTQVERPTIEVIIEELEKALHFQENRKKTLDFSLDHIRLGVENFSVANCIMRGRFGMLYKGKVQYNNRHKKVVVKRFSYDRHMNDTIFSWEHGFLKEFEVLFKHKHENVIGLVGYCNETDEKIIVYEHASKGSLDRYLNDTSLSWTKRLKICIDIANGLKFLHGGDLGKGVVTHRNIKSSNILLNKDWKAKICGFELALIYPSNQDPEIHSSTKEYDIYSFGVILFEILCGRLARPEDFKDRNQFLDVVIKRHFQEAPLDEIAFEGIKEQIGWESLATFRWIAFQCLLDERKERPTAGDVVVQLQKALKFQEAYEIQKAKLHIFDKEIPIKSREIYSAMAKKDIYNILSKGILLEDDKLEIIHALQLTTLDVEQEDDDYE